MKKKRICVIGNFSGRNAGDAAILGGLMEDISSLYDNVLFEIPTINPKFVRQSYPGYAVRPISLMPWNLSVKIFGLPIFRSVLSADLILVTDAILFDRKLFNPLFNYLSTMALVLPLAKKRGIPVVLYNVNLGPVYSKAGISCMRRVVDSSDLVLVRDTESIVMLDKIGIRCNGVEMGADCALNVIPTQGHELERVLVAEHLDCSDEKTITFNVNAYVNRFIKDGNQKSKEEFTSIIALAVDRIIEELGVRILFVVTHPMDLRITNMVMKKLRRGGDVSMLSNVRYSYQDLAGILSKAPVHVGMRTHSLIFASSAHTPIVGIIGTPKNRGYMRSIQQEQRMIEFSGLTSANLVQMTISTYKARHIIRDAMGPIMDREKEKARAGARRLAPYLS